MQQPSLKRNNESSSNYENPNNKKPNTSSSSEQQEEEHVNTAVMSSRGDEPSLEQQENVSSTESSSTIAPTTNTMRGSTTTDKISENVIGKYNNDYNVIISNIVCPKSKAIPSYEDANYEESDDVDRKIGFTQAELEFLNTLNQYNLRDLTVPNSKTSDPLSFKLQHREEALQQIVNVGKEQFQSFSAANKNNQKVNFFMATGGSGSGKTRILTEIPKILRTSQELDVIFKNTNIIYFNFANGFSLSNTDRDNKLVSMIVSRIVFAAFERSSTIATRTPPSENDKFLYEVLRIISNKLHERYGTASGVIPLVLAFDEYQFTTRPNPNLHSSIQHLLGSYMRHIQNRHQILLFPAFGGTFDPSMEPTQYVRAAELSLPLMRPIDIEEIMNDMGLSNLYKGEYREFWNVIGIVPRHLEWALNDIEKLKSVELNDEIVQSILSSNVANTVKKQYSSHLRDDYFGELALRTLSGLKQDKDEKIATYMKEGKVYGDANSYPVGLPLVLVDVLSTTIDYIPKRIVTDFITVFNRPLCERFEELCLKTMIARFNLLYTLKRSATVKFSELFQGAHFKSDLAFTTLRTFNPLWFGYKCSNDDFISSDDQEQNEQLLHPTSLIKVKKNQDDIDGVLCPLVNTETKQRIVFITQNKFQHYEEQSQQNRTTLEPGELVSYYEKAVRTPFTNSDTFVIMFTNRRVSENTRGYAPNLDPTRPLLYQIW